MVNDDPNGYVCIAGRNRPDNHEAGDEQDADRHNNDDTPAQSEFPAAYCLFHCFAEHGMTTFNFEISRAAGRINVDAENDCSLDVGESGNVGYSDSMNASGW